MTIHTFSKKEFPTLFGMLFNTILIFFHTNMETGAKIRKLRELRNFTQEYMAEQLGLSPNGYGKIEREEVKLTFENLEKILKTLGVSLPDFLDFDEKKVFFNIINTPKAKDIGSANGININSSVNTIEKELYETQINLLKEEVVYLKNLIDSLLIQIKKE